jgi:hypothetical protein
MCVCQYRLAFSALKLASKFSTLCNKKKCDWKHKGAAGLEQNQPPPPPSLTFIHTTKQATIFEPVRRQDSIQRISLCCSEGTSDSHHIITHSRRGVGKNSGISVLRKWSRGEKKDRWIYITTLVI